MNPLFYFVFLLESCSFAPLIFSKYGGPLPWLHCQISETRNSCFQDGAVSSSWLVLLLTRKCGPLVWGFLTCSVVIWCRQVVLLGAFAHWFSWHQGLTDLGASELVVSSHVPKYLHSRPTADPFLIGLS